MKLSNFKLAGQLAIGFGAIIVITLIIGIMATINMFTAANQADGIATRYVPATAAANEIELGALRTMYAMRGYAYTRETDYLDEMRNYLD